MKRHSFLTLFLFLSLSLRIFGEDAKKGEVPFRIVSYNVENFFESLPDTSAKNPFSPQGVRRWTKWKYKTKISHISQALLACGEDKIPSLIGLCEIGSEKVLYDLVHSSPLWKLNYDYILAETQDVRHIHTALLYCKEDFRPLEIQSLEVDLSQYTTYRPTRCILYVKGLNTYSQDTLHIFVVHFPSRSGGMLETEPYRMKASQRLHLAVDSLFAHSSQSFIIAMGDFNDTPKENSFQKGIQVKALKKREKTLKDRELYLLPHLSFHPSVEGSYKFHGVWYDFDQILISSSLMSRCKEERGYFPYLQICDFDFLLTEDVTYLGIRPFPTYYGMKYQGGFSDHLPIKVDLYF